MLDKDISLKKLNLLEIGLNSLQTMRIVNRLKQMGAVISFAELMEKPYIEKWWEILSERMKLEDLLSDQKDTKAISKESNSLTDVQYAYWIGRGKKQILGGVSCHAYFEFSGVEVLRKMTKDRKKNIIIPVVYTSTVGMAADDDMTVKNPITYKISQTPQVYIDCQAAEENNGCTINWDVRDGVFDDFIIEAMFESFKELLLSSCETMNNRFEEKQPVYLPSDMRSVREKINDTKESISPYAKGNLTFELIKGWHLDCITEPNLGENIKKMLDFNY